MKKACVVCGKEFEVGAGGGKTCGEECKRRHVSQRTAKSRARRGQAKTCVICGRPLEGCHKAAKTCGEKCREIRRRTEAALYEGSRRRKRHMKKCAYCGAEFLADSASKKYCTTRHGQLADYARKCDPKPLIEQNCIACGIPIPSKWARTMCKQCRNRHRARPMSTEDRRRLAAMKMAKDLCMVASILESKTKEIQS